MDCRKIERLFEVEWVMSNFNKDSRLEKRSIIRFEWYVIVNIFVIRRWYRM